MKKRLLALMVTLISFAGIFSTLQAEEQNVLVLYSTDSIISLLNKTHGEIHHAYYPMQFTDPARISSYATGGAAGWNGMLMANPPNNDYHDVEQWFYQRYLPIIDDQYTHHASNTRRDWSAYNHIRFEAYATANPMILGMLVKDGAGPLGYLQRGAFSPVYTWEIFPGDTVTCSFPLTDVCTEGELDQTKMQGFFLRYAGYAGNGTLALMNIRLVGSGTGNYPIVNVREAYHPFSRLVTKNMAKTRDAAKLVKNLTPVTAQVGPVTVFTGVGGYSCAEGHFGGSGGTYYQNTRRGIVAYDNDRILISFGTGSTPPASALVLNDGPRISYFGINMMATWNGGQTWGGLDSGDARPYFLNNWYQRSNASANSETGELYLLGTQNCSSYHGAIDMFFRKMIFTGDKWEEERISIIDQIENCPGLSLAVKLPNGRIWATLRDGHDGHGMIAKYSDDDGYSWMPCKDAAAPVPRPWYNAGVDPVPDSVVNFPGEFVSGAIVVPYGDSVAAFSEKGDKWKIHNGQAWSSERSVPVWGWHSEYDPLYNYVTATVIEGDHIFLAKGGRYSNVKTERTTNLVATHYNDGVWSAETLVTDSVVIEAIITASGNAVFLFYVEKSVDSTYKILYRKWAGGSWSAGVELATETVRINRMAAPQICPPTYACVLYDELKQVSGQSTWIKFIKIPSDPGLLVATKAMIRGTAGSPYTSKIDAAGGTLPYTWSLTSGSLPAGLSLAADGTVSGTPTESGSFSFVVSVIDGNSDAASGEVSLVISPSSAVQANIIKKAETQLTGVRPNPFSSSTTISYGLSGRSTVSLKIYAMNGKLLHTIIDKTEGAGHYQVYWKPEHLTPGVYFIKFTAGNHLSVKKMMLLK
ncbi:MAG: putative Ig domain-containing protein [Fibrobacterota bacterium]